MAQAEFTSTVAENYEKHRGTMIFMPYAKDMAARLHGNISSLLEIACGTGQVTRLLRAQFPDARITASDLSPEMIEVAKKIIGEQDKIEWLIADAMALPFDENTFDAVICQFGLMFVPDKQKGVDEAYRVLKPGGRFIFSTWDTLQNNPINSIAQEVTNSFFKNEPLTFCEIPFSMYDPGELKKLMTDGGFKNVKVQKISLRGYSPSVRAAVIGLTTGSVIYSNLAEQRPELIQEIQDKITEAFIKEFGAENLSIPLSAWITEGIK